MRPKFISGRFKCSICQYNTDIYFDHFLFHLDKEKFIFVYRKDIANSPGYLPQVARSKYYIKMYIYWNDVYVDCPKCHIDSMAFNKYLFDDLTDFEKFIDDLDTFQMAPYRYIENGRTYVELLPTKEIEQIMNEEQSQDEIKLGDHLKKGRFPFHEMRTPERFKKIFVTGEKLQARKTV